MEKMFHPVIKLTVKNMQNHFIVNPEWRRVFTAYFPKNDTTNDNYFQRMHAVFVANGCKVTIGRRMNDNPQSEYYSLVRADIHRDGEWLYGTDWVQETEAAKKLYLWAICDYDINIATFPTPDVLHTPEKDG